MKKLIALLLAVLMVFALVACASNEAKTEEPDTTPADTTPADTTPADTTPADTTPADEPPLPPATKSSSSASHRSARNPAGVMLRPTTSSGTLPVTSTPSSWSSPMHSRSRRTRSRRSAPSSRWALTSSRSRPLSRPVGKLF